MTLVDSTAVLNRLVAIHNRTLPMYLANSTRAWFSQDDTVARETLDAIAADQQATVARLSQMVMDQSQAVTMGSFPMEFTSLHDLSLDYLVGRAIEWQRRDQSLIEAAAAELDADTDEKALAEKAVGAAKGHLESLTELVSN